MFNSSKYLLPSVIYEQLSVIFGLPRLFVASFTLVLPLFPISRGGPTILVIYDIHALQERFYFSDNVLPYFETGIPLLKQRLHQLPHADNVVIAFPDDGAWKRFHKQLDHFATKRWTLERCYKGGARFLKKLYYIEASPLQYWMNIMNV
ncbi:hypothetical protein L1887_02246 [Cichorium endivia]|nr:hypothetical protein L1887_02246 [Cichorium endivia]